MVLLIGGENYRDPTPGLASMLPGSLRVLKFIDADERVCGELESFQIDLRDDFRALKAIYISEYESKKPPAYVAKLDALRLDFLQKGIELKYRGYRGQSRRKITEANESSTPEHDITHPPFMELPTDP
jgi:hypothetical protein